MRLLILGLRNSLNSRRYNIQHVDVNNVGKFVESSLLAMSYKVLGILKAPLYLIVFLRPNSSLS